MTREKCDELEKAIRKLLEEMVPDSDFVEIRIQMPPESEEIDVVVEPYE